MTWLQLSEMLTHMALTTEGKKALNMPVIVANREKRKFLGIQYFELLKDMQDLPCLVITKKDADKE